MNNILKRIPRIRLINYAVHRATRLTPPSHLVSQNQTEVHMKPVPAAANNASHNKIWLGYSTATPQINLIYSNN